MKQNFDIEGIFHKRLDNVTFKSGNHKAEFVLEILDKGKDDMTYRDFPKFEVIGKFDAILDGVNEGDRVKVRFSLGGRKWRAEGSDIDKYFSSLTAWDLTVLEKAGGEMVANDVNKTEDFTATSDDDLPF